MDNCAVWSSTADAITDLSRVCAVCVPPGALLILHDIPPKMQRECGTGPEDTVIFTQISADVNRHRDAVRFSTGREMRLQELGEGQRVEVLRLAATQDQALDDTNVARLKAASF